MFLCKLNGLLDGLVAEGTQLGHHPGHLGGLDVKIGLGLGGLGGEMTHVLHHVIDEPKKTVKIITQEPTSSAASANGV